MDRSIIEGLQDIVVLLEAQLQPLVQAESSVIVDVLFQPEYLFPAETGARRKCHNGRFIQRYFTSFLRNTLGFDLIELKFRLIKHTERLLEDKEEKLCIQVLHTLRQMMNFDIQNGEKVRSRNYSFTSLVPIDTIIIIIVATTIIYILQ